LLPLHPADSLVTSSSCCQPCYLFILLPALLLLRPVASLANSLTCSSSCCQLCYLSILLPALLWYLFILLPAFLPFHPAASLVNLFFLLPGF
jgi:hypothetical protein